MSKTYYKLVYPSNNKLLSCQTSQWGSLYDEYCVEYLIGQYVSPNIPNTKLMVFDNLKDAIHFKDDLIDKNLIQIFSCGIKGKCIHAPFAEYIFDIEEVIRQYIKYKKQHKGEGLYKKGLAPKGTVFCNQVKLLKRIQ